ncbi:MAG: SPOR domain-containing protein [Flavobacteriaceae bacterium]|nr:SPOR domain-containing protein [Flavobacteriaceae bacterium]
MMISKKYFFIAFLALATSFSAFSQEKTSKKIKDLISQKRSFYQKNKNTSVFIIQLYNGNEKKAYTVKNEFESTFSGYKTIMSYKLPEWKVQVGYFYTRLEADIALNKIKKKFEGAIVLEDKI